MPTKFSAAELTNMRSAQADSLQDACYIQALSQSPNSFGEVINTWADSGSEISCGLEMQPGSEVRDVDKTLVQYDAILRLPVTTTVSETQRIRVTKRYGESLSTALVFDIASPPQRGPSGIRVLLNKVST